MAWIEESKPSGFTFILTLISIVVDLDIADLEETQKSIKVAGGAEAPTV